jgi:hypothetical protein
MVTHINTKVTNQERRNVRNTLNLFEIMKMATAKSSDQIPHIAPFIGSDGNVIPSLS